MQFALVERRKSNAVEFLGIERELGGHGGELAVGVGGESVGVVGDVGLVDPVGALLLIGKIGELLLGVVDEFLGLLGGGHGRGGVSATLWRSLLGARVTLGQ